TKAKRLDKDFVIRDDQTNEPTAERAALLARLDPETGDLGKEGFTGVFYFNEETGFAHGFGTVNYLVIYDGTPDNYIVVPIREPETKSTFNDPTEPNCVGVFRGDALDPDIGCVPNNGDPTRDDYFAWSGPNGPLGEGPATVSGYFYIPELEQVYSTVLQSTLCVSYPTFDDSKTAGWATDTNRTCRSNAAFDPRNPTTGLPKGDWCAKTNSAATADCHDAYRSTSFHAFQAYKIKDETCAP
ncbi:MAG: hypothetical protein FJ104_07690, partial [Deltaproteobacteria bacterium]|nr:hypothetical protein [Deltaproteobacteria bacterium]